AYVFAFPGRAATRSVAAQTRGPAVSLQATGVPDLRCSVARCTASGTRGSVMFTGIVTDLGEVRSIKARANNLHRITIFTRYPRAELVEGASVACSGVCLTVVDAGEEGGRTWFAVDAADETLRVTGVGRWRHGTRVNLERPLKVGDELGGHLVAGHVDGLARVLAREDMTDMARFTLRAPHDLARFITAKGSAALDGVSLTVNA